MLMMTIFMNGHGEHRKGETSVFSARMLIKKKNLERRERVTNEVGAE